ncbi:MAG: SWIB/MDM2 domain-containing protein, partial [Olpidium bornovanus]
RKAAAGKEAGGRKREPNPNNPFNAPLQLSEPLAALVGATEIVKAIWAYIKDKGLQDESDKRYIVCDARLTSLFDTDRVHMFTMNKLISKHVDKDGGKRAKDDGGRQTGEAPAPAPPPPSSSPRPPQQPPPPPPMLST